MRLLACALLGFLFGGLNGAIMISRTKMHEDVRSKGSGNAGMTNFLRSYGGWATLLVVAIDFGKAVAAMLLATLICPQNPVLAKMVTGFAVQVGHVFPLYFGFRGGKGILCSGAVAVMMDWRFAVTGLPLFLLIFFLTRYVSLASVITMLALIPLYILFFPNQPWIWALAAAMTALSVFMHRSNIRRLLRGEERKTYFHKSKNE